MLHLIEQSSIEHYRNLISSKNNNSNFLTILGLLATFSSIAIDENRIDIDGGIGSINITTIER